MLYHFPHGTFAVVVRDYDKPYEDPISASAGDLVRPVLDGSMETDVIGWTWCVGPDGRVGWTPDNWCRAENGGWRLLRDFRALELTVRRGERLRLLFGESGFLFCETPSGDRAWVPDAVLALEG